MITNMNKFPIVSIIIVDFFKAERVINNVAGALEQVGNFELEIIVVDNSVDKKNSSTLEKHLTSPQITLIVNSSNDGYIKACNDAVARSRGDFIFLVNPDILWKGKDIVARVMSQFQKENSIGIIGIQQVNDDGTTPEIVRQFPNLLTQISRRTILRRLPWFRRRVDGYEMKGFDYSVSDDIDWIQSSFMAIRRNVWNEVGGLDESYFLFMSDPDICYKSWELSYRVFYMADVLVWADGKRCSAGGLTAIFHNSVIRYHLRDALIYQLKYLSKKKLPKNRNGLWLKN
jgi:N-acetylglucosaminyl-diphospho-decaprenol L-rhamnosyltransferase